MYRNLCRKVTEKSRFCDCRWVKNTQGDKNTTTHRNTAHAVNISAVAYGSLNYVTCLEEKRLNSVNIYFSGWFREVSSKKTDARRRAVLHQLFLRRTVSMATDKLCVSMILGLLCVTTTQLCNGQSVYNYIVSSMLVNKTILSISRICGHFRDSWLAWVSICVMWLCWSRDQY